MKETDATQTGMTVTGRRPWAKLSEYLAAPLVLVTPFVLFVTYHEYRLLSPEILWCVLILVGIGLMASVVTLLGGMARVLISAGLLTFYLDVQIDWLTPRMIAATYLGLVPVCWLLRRHVWELMAGFSTVTVVLTLAFPESTRIGENASVQEETTAPAATLPPLLHIALDEHIGVAGIPTDISGGRALRTALVEFYEGNGFRLFGRAFSQYVNTRDSMSNLLNLTSEDRSAVHGALRAHHQGLLPRAHGPDRRGLAASRRPRVRRALPPRTESPGARPSPDPAAVDGTATPWSRPVPPAARWDVARRLSVSSVIHDRPPIPRSSFWTVRASRFASRRKQPSPASPCASRSCCGRARRCPDSGASAASAGSPQSAWTPGQTPSPR